MAETTVSGSIKEITDTLTDLLDHTLSTGISVFQSLSKSGSDLGAKLAPVMKSLPLPKTESCCKIPPPCWMPRQVGEVSSHVCPGGSATLRIRVTNCGLGTRTITAEADQGAKVSPESIQVAPMQRGWLTVSFSVAATAGNGESSEILVWIRGCKNHYVRWTVTASNRGCECCHEINVEDCPDLVHHWYDHFYCVRGCQSDLRQVPGR
jgi:hypothetical protein